ncbi:MAG: hypothetical protein HC824_16810 [Synechococcales cyanobacterium RM1_1_8]|nr:hypothetical protein [Synechococcales cyanobacterium RM1_1_8]
MTTLDPLERVVSALARDPNLPRVKKLLYCACYGVWEDSLDRLDQVSLREVVQGVWERSPTLEALQFQLNRVVKTLNKPVAYAHVANGVLRILTELYLDTYDMTRPMGRFGALAAPMAAQEDWFQSNPPASQTPASQTFPDLDLRFQASPANVFEEETASTEWFTAQAAAGPTPAQISAQAAVRAHVVQSLSGHPEQLRLKKLLLCVCENIWENSQERLVAVNWEALLDETQRLVPLFNSLEDVLGAIVNSLSKPVEYLRLAQTILELVTPLYEQSQPDETQFFGMVPEPGESNSAWAAMNSLAPERFAPERFAPEQPMPEHRQQLVPRSEAQVSSPARPHPQASPWSSIQASPTDPQYYAQNSPSLELALGLMVLLRRFPPSGSAEMKPWTTCPRAWRWQPCPPAPWMPAILPEPCRQSTVRQCRPQPSPQPSPQHSPQHSQDNTNPAPTPTSCPAPWKPFENQPRGRARGRAIEGRFPLLPPWRPAHRPRGRSGRQPQPWERDLPKPRQRGGKPGICPAPDADALRQSPDGQGGGLFSATSSVSLLGAGLDGAAPPQPVGSAGRVAESLPQLYRFGNQALWGGRTARSA